MDAARYTWLVKSADWRLVVVERQFAQPRSAAVVLSPVSEREVEHPAGLGLITLVILRTSRVATSLDEPQMLMGVAVGLPAVETADLCASARQHVRHPSTCCRRRLLMSVIMAGFLTEAHDA